MNPAVRQALDHLRHDAAGTSTAACFDSEPDRLGEMSLSAAGLRVDFSKQRIRLQNWHALAGLAKIAGVARARQAMFDGEPINTTEQRAVLHTALRQPERAPDPAAVREVFARMAMLSDTLHQGARTGATGNRFTDVVNIGIGGSHLGPELACDALRSSDTGLHAHFLANVDGGEFERIAAGLNPATTLFVVASKSFTTVETLLNARTAQSWLKASLGATADTGRHFIAVTSKPERATEFGIEAANIYPMWDWVGGRYSMWSAIGMPIALARGMAAFESLRDGARAMDEHFLDAPHARNIPVMMALTGLWNSDLLGAASYAVVPYDDRLRYLPAYLQQLEMESNGKRVTNAGALVEHETAPVTWGGLGTNAQHAFFQLLHQGTRLVPVDFIVAMSHPAELPAHHDMLVSNCFAQAEALMCGRDFESGTATASGPDLTLHRQSPGNRPSTMITMDELGAFELGALIALYEHKTFVQSVLWDINAFDQWGVELGKVLAESILTEFTAASPGDAHDPSTAALIRRYRAARRPT